jgi:uncharacterized cupin superfamily protein
MPRIDIAGIKLDTSTGYPAHLSKAVDGRSRTRLGHAAGPSQFGVTASRRVPGAASSLRHWHHNEDEFVDVLEGEVTLCEDDGEIVLKPGEAAGWKAGVANGHCLINRSQRDAVFLEVGSRAEREVAEYPDHDMKFERDGASRKITRKNGEPF